MGQRCLNFHNQGRGLRESFFWDFLGMELTFKMDASFLIYSCAVVARKVSHVGGYGSIPVDTFLVGWTSIYQLFWGSLGTRVLTHPHVLSVSIRFTPRFVAETIGLCDVDAVRSSRSAASNELETEPTEPETTMSIGSPRRWEPQISIWIFSAHWFGDLWRLKVFRTKHGGFHKCWEPKMVDLEGKFLWKWMI